MTLTATIFLSAERAREGNLLINDCTSSGPRSLLEPERLTEDRDGRWSELVSKGDVRLLTSSYDVAVMTRGQDARLLLC